MKNRKFPQIKCPKCGSKDIEIETGINNNDDVQLAVTGQNGISSVSFICNKCKYRWEPYYPPNKLYKISTILIIIMIFILIAVALLSILSWNI